MSKFMNFNPGDADMTLSFIGTNPSTQHLADKKFVGATMNYLPDQLGNMHLIEVENCKFLLDIKDTKVYNGKVVVFGVLQDSENVGNVAIQLNV